MQNDTADASGAGDSTDVADPATTTTTTTAAPSAVMTLALDVVGLLRDTGLAVVEPEPTPAMVAAGVAASGLGADRVRAVFKAMLAAGGTVAGRVQ
ncbi:hypothetical protein [Skermanella pratensis]|uniref:hypothetical protein n=1 Tax=Skermanella pratensis TaxID=2233999 RepID=UPI0013012C54|nr:hypothetical protein [Skermanella pratensis]